jgi:hypothetical protein
VSSKQPLLVAAVRNYLQRHPEAAQRLRSAELQAHLNHAPLVDAQGLVDQPSSRSLEHALPPATRLPDEDDHAPGLRLRPAASAAATSSATSSSSSSVSRDASVGSIDEYSDLLTFGKASAQPRALNFGQSSSSSSSQASASASAASSSSTPSKSRPAAAAAASPAGSGGGGGGGSGSGLTRDRYLALADEALDAMLELQAMPESSWEELHTKQDIVVSRRPVKGSPLHVIRGVGVVDASATDVLSLIVNVERRKCK